MSNSEVTASLRTWEPLSTLRSISHSEARYGRGFVCAEPASWFPRVGELWMPLLHMLSEDFQLIGVQKSFGLPENFQRRTIFEVDGEPTLLAYDLDTERQLSSVVVPGVQGVAQGAVIEYLERRILSTLKKAWGGKETLSANYLSANTSTEFQLAGSIGLSFNLADVTCSIWFGVGPVLLEKLDANWRERLFAEYREQGLNPFTDQVHKVSVELTELAVAPAMLIDYMRSGTVVDLEVPVSNKVQLRVDGRVWAEGNLCRYNDLFAVQIANRNPAERSFPDGTTKVRIEVASTELDQEGLIEHAQNTAFLISDTTVDSKASLIISGENVATAIVGEIEDRFALSILPK